MVTYQVGQDVVIAFSILSLLNNLKDTNKRGVRRFPAEKTGDYKLIDLEQNNSESI